MNACTFKLFCFSRMRTRNIHKYQTCQKHFRLNNRYIQYCFPLLCSAHWMAPQLQETPNRQEAPNRPMRLICSFTPKGAHSIPISSQYSVFQVMLCYNSDPNHDASGKYSLITLVVSITPLRTGPDSSVGRVSAPGNGRSRIRSRGIETIHRQDNSSTRFLETIHRHN